MIELACIGQGPYLRHTAAMLHSALSHAAPGSVAVHLLHETAIDAGEDTRLRQTLAPFGAQLHLHAVPESMLMDFPSGYFPRAIWLRVLLPDLLPAHDRVLYLDSDMIVCDDLLPLWQTRLDDVLLAAVPNPFYPFMPPYPRLRLGIGGSGEYFNSGMLLMNLAAMREADLAGQLRALARANPDYLYPDQDALNVACRGRWRPVHPRWNAQSTLFELPADALPFSPAVVAETRAKPAVIHYIGPFKPWHYLCRHPSQQAYFRHARLTPWGAPSLEGRSAKNFVLRQLPLLWIDRALKAERWMCRALRRLAGRLQRVA